MGGIFQVDSQKPIAGVLGPELAVNMAMSADGRVASASRGWMGFSSGSDHSRLLHIRTQYDAIVCGARTVDTQPFTLDSGGETYRHMRQRLGLREDPLRVIVSPSGSLDPNAAVFESPGGPVVVVVGPSSPLSARRLLSQRADVLWTVPDDAEMGAAILERLSKEYRVGRVLLEGGPRLNELFFRSGLVDRLFLTICPILVCGASAPGIADGLGAASLADAFRMDFLRAQRCGDEVFLELTRRKKGEPEGSP